MPLPDLTGDIVLNDKSEQAFQSVIRNAGAANQAVNLTGQQLRQLEGYLQQFGLRMDTLTGRFADLGTGASLPFADALRRLPADAESGIAAFDRLVGNLRALTNEEEGAGTAARRLADNLNVLGSPNSAGLTRLQTQLTQMRQQAESLSTRANTLSQIQNVGGDTNQIRATTEELKDLGSTAKDVREQTNALRDSLKQVADPKTADMERFQNEFLGIEQNIKQATSRLGSMKKEMLATFGPEFAAGLGEEIEQGLQQKIGKGIKNFVALTPGGLIPGSDRALLALGSAFESMSPAILLAAGSLGLFAAAGAGAYLSVRQMEASLRQLEINGLMRQRFSVTFNVDDVDKAVTDLKAQLGNRLTKQEAFEIALKVDKTSVLTDLTELGAVIKVIQGYATAYGLEWKGVSLQVIEAINQVDGSFLENGGYIDSAKGALVEYAEAHGTTYQALTKTEQQQALINALFEKLGPIAADAKTPVDNLAGAQEALGTSFTESKTAIGDWFAVWLNPQATSFAEEFTRRLNNVRTYIDDFNAYLAGQTNEQILKNRLGDSGARNFENVQLELERIRKEQREISSLGSSASESDREQLQHVMDRLEARRRELQAGMDKAFAQLKAGEQISPLPESTHPGDFLIQLENNQAKINAQYKKEIAAANDQVTATTQKVTEAEAALQRVQSGEAQAVYAATQGNAAAIEQRKQQLATATQQVQQLEAALANPPKIANPQATDMERQIATMKSQRLDVIQTLIDTNAQMSTLGDLAKSGQVVAGFDQQLKALQSSGVSNVTEMEKQNKEIARLSQERAIAFSQFQMAVQDAVGKGIALPTSGSLDEIMKAIGAATTENTTKLQAYQTQIDQTSAKIGDMETRLSKLPGPQIDTAALGQIQTQLDQARQTKTALENEVAQLQQQMNDQARTASATSALAKQQAESALTDAQGKLAAANALTELLAAERAYLLSHQQLLDAQQSGNVGLELQAEQTERNALNQMQLMQLQAKATIGAQAYADSIKRVAEALGQPALATPTAAPGQQGNGWQDALNRLQGIADQNPVQWPVVLAPPQTGTAGGVPSPTGGQQGDAAKEVGAVGKAADEAAAAERRFAEAFNLSVAAGHAVNEAYRSLLAARQAGNAISIKNAQAEYDLAVAHQTSADNATRAAIADLNKARADAQAAVASAQHARNTEASASANNNYGRSADAAAAASDNLARAGGLAVDAVTRLPVAFHSAGLNAAQLEAQLRDLAAALQDIQAAAVNAAFSISGSLVPVVGIMGSLQQGSAWAEQAGELKSAFEAGNEARVAAGQDPLGAQVLDTAMGALRANWSAYAQDATASMDKVESGGAAHANKMEKLASQIDKALDGMVRGVLQDSTKGLIPGDIESKLLPREDAIDEPARRMADVAVKGFKSPWFAGLKQLFPDEILQGGEEAIRKAAAGMVRAHQEGLSTMLYDADAAAQKVIEQLQGKQNMDQFVQQVREKVKALGKDVDGLDIKKALGIELNEEDLLGGGGGGGGKRVPALSKVLSFDQIKAQMDALFKNQDSPLVGLMEPKDAGKEKITKAGKDSGSQAGEAMVNQVIEGKYGERSMAAIVTQLKTKEQDIKESGQKVADWLGGALVDRFSTTVPQALLDILVDHLAEAIDKAASAKEERKSGTEK